MRQNSIQKPTIEKPETAIKALQDKKDLALVNQYIAYLATMHPAESNGALNDMIEAQRDPTQRSAIFPKLISWLNSVSEFQFGKRKTFPGYQGF